MVGFFQILLYTLCIAQQNLSIGVNVVSKGLPSRLGRVRRISLGITVLPKSSILLTKPVMVFDKLFELNVPVAFLYLSAFAIHLAGGYQPPAYNYFIYFAPSKRTPPLLSQRRGFG